MVPAPARPFMVQLPDKLMEVDLHDFGVAVGLSEAEVDLAGGIQSRYYTDPRYKPLLSQRVGGAGGLPLPAAVVSHT